MNIFECVKTVNVIWQL